MFKSKGRTAGHAMQPCRKLLNHQENMHLACTLAVFSICAIHSPGIYAYVSLASLVALLMASICFLGDLSTIDSKEWKYPQMQMEPDVWNLFRTLGKNINRQKHFVQFFRASMRYWIAGCLAAYNLFVLCV